MTADATRWAAGVHARTDGLPARTDGFTSLAVILGAIGVALGFPLADPIIGMLITVAIVAVFPTAVRDVVRRLLER